MRSTPLIATRGGRAPFYCKPRVGASEPVAGVSDAFVLTVRGLFRANPPVRMSLFPDIDRVGLTGPLFGHFFA